MRFRQGTLNSTCITDCHVGAPEGVRGGWVRSLPNKHNGSKHPLLEWLPIIDGIYEWRLSRLHASITRSRPVSL